VQGVCYYFIQTRTRKEKEMDKKKRIQPLVVVLVILGLFLMNGCATYGNIPRERISEGDKAIHEARESNASLNAPVELKAAEDKLAAAKTALDKKNYDEAIRLADQASVDADYARVKAVTQKEKKKAEELRQNIKTTRQEIETLSKQ
jgi:hypothetical protein